MAQQIGNISVGAKVKFGSYQVGGEAPQPIIWTVVAKNHPGYPVNSVTLHTSGIIDLRCFDAKEPNAVNSYHRARGNNYYLRSNIAQWLNTDKGPYTWYTAQYVYDQAPDSEAVCGVSHYAGKAGFLSLFTENERNCVLETTLKLSRPRGVTGDGVKEDIFKQRVFLPSIVEVGFPTTDEFSIPWGYYGGNPTRFGYLTAQAYNNTLAAKPSSIAKPWCWYTRDCNTLSEYTVFSINVKDDNMLEHSDAYASNVGIRLALNINALTMVGNMDGEGCYAVIFNQSPGVSPWISIPDGLLGGNQTTITWGGSSDPDNNLAGYRLERNVNGGGWGQVYQGGALSFVDTIVFGWGSVQYRVKAYDTYGVESDYSYSAQCGILNNRSPGAPGWCNLPDGLLGGNRATITWAAGSDPDNNLAGYRLEQSVNGGAWGQIFDGNTLAFTAAITYGWTSIQYRVKSYDVHGWESGYTTSPVRSIINNRAPVISDSDRALGTFAETAPAVPYTVTDAENDIVTITEKLDGQVLRTYTATLGAAVTLPIGSSVWLTAGNGDHTLQVVASDGRDTTTRTWSFTKAETAISFTLAGPQETAGATKKIVITPTWQVEGAAPKVEVCNNGFDAAPTWEDVTDFVVAGRAYYLQNTVKTGEKWGLDIRFTITRTGIGQVSMSGFGGAHE